MNFLISTLRHTTRAFLGACMLLLTGLVLSISLTSCGGGVSGGGTGGGGPKGPLDAASLASSFGSVNGLGSIFVGLYEFDDAIAKVTAQDGFPVTANDLAMGVQVSVANQITSQSLALNANNATSSILIKRMFMGVLRANPGNSESALLNGQQLFFDRRTAVAGALSPLGLVDTWVQVSGYLEPTLNTVVITRIEPATAAQITQNQIYLTARVLSVGAANATASVGFATLSLVNISPAVTIKANDVVRVQGTFEAASTTVVSAARVTQLKPESGEGGSTFRGIVSSRPTAASPSTPLVVDGYTIELPVNTIPADVRRGSVLEVRGLLTGTTLTSVSYTVVSNPKITLPGEDPIEDVPSGNPNGVPLPDYLIYKSPVQSVNADGSFVVRGLRVIPFVIPGQSAPVVVVGQVISIAGEARSDALGFYISASFDSIPP
jgi:hypothetical protein